MMHTGDKNRSDPAEGPDFTVDRLAGILADAAPAGHFDALRGGSTEAIAGTGDSRASSCNGFSAAWQQFFGVLDVAGAGEFDRLANNVARRVHENGISYNVYADHEDVARPWSLDLFPLIIEAHDWERVAAGITQRAQLLNTIVADAYGERRLLREGVLPPALVFDNPGYLRPMHGYRPPGDVWLPIVAFDLSRDAQGNWWVVSQRTQAPSGLGYLLENRLIISAQFPAAFRALRVQRVASSYRRLMQGLMALSPAGRDARAVLLTPGPYNETYFEHAYLARHLGISLVEGDDLTVRDDALYLKTLGGLEKVDVVLRRLDDDFCDPLELRPDSALGVPGLLRAMRAGNVVVASAPGSGFIESPGVLGFLPPLSRLLLGEELQLPSLPTWWCGEAAVRDDMLGQLPGSVIKPTFPHRNFEPVHGRMLDHGERAQWQARIADDPAAFSVQQYLPLMHVPTWDEGRIQPRACMLRVFAIHDGRSGWSVLPGGLARVGHPGETSVSMRRGGSSVDVWVLAEGEVEVVSLRAPAMTPADIAARHRPVSSRAAEHLFWLGRYTERAENVARVARLTLECLNGEGMLSARTGDWLADLCAGMGLVPATPASGDGSAILGRNLVAALAGGGGCPGVGGILDALARTARPIRERLPTGHWQLLADAPPAFRGAIPNAGELQVPEALLALERLDVRLTAITGAQTDRMTRDNGWRLLSIGRQIERLSALAGILAGFFRRKLIDDAEAFSFVLAAFDSSITFRAQFQRRFELAPLLELLVFDSGNPRSLTWVLQTMRGRIVRLGGDAPETRDALLAGLPDPAGWDLDALWRDADQGEGRALIEILEHCAHSARMLSDTIEQHYFSHAHGVHRQIRA